MKKQKLILVIVLAVIFILLVGQAEAVEEIIVKVDGRVIDFPDAKPFISAEGRTLVPVRFVSQELGAAVTYVASERKVVIRKDNEDITLYIDSDIAERAGKKISLGTKAIIKNDRTFVPLRFVSEALGAGVEWDGANRTVIISTGKQVPVLITPVPTPTPIPTDRVNVNTDKLTDSELTMLKSYPDYMSNGQFYANNDLYVKVYGIDYAQKAVDIAKGYIETYYNQDYRTIGDAFRNEMKNYVHEQDFGVVEDLVIQSGDYKITAKGKFLSSPSLVYFDGTGSLRVRGNLRFIVYSCTDIERIFGKGVKINQWIEQDCEVELVSYSLNRWSYWHRGTHIVSSKPRFIKGVE